MGRDCRRGFPVSSKRRGGAPSKDASRGFKDRGLQPRYKRLWPRQEAAALLQQSFEGCPPSYRNGRNRDKARPSVEQKSKTSYSGALDKCRPGRAYTSVNSCCKAMTKTPYSSHSTKRLLAQIRSLFPIGNYDQQSL